jgi:hypothetical protein
MLLACSRVLSYNMGLDNDQHLLAHDNHKHLHSSGDDQPSDGFSGDPTKPTIATRLCKAMKKNARFQRHHGICEKLHPGVLPERGLQQTSPHLTATATMISTPTTMTPTAMTSCLVATLMRPRRRRRIMERMRTGAIAIKTLTKLVSRHRHVAVDLLQSNSDLS